MTDHTTPKQSVPFSILDLSLITQGNDAGQALRNSRDLAQHAERWGYNRYWLAEHHNMSGVASAATSVVVGFVADGTNTIRVGSGGIMLPNHSPLVIAEQFGTLESLYPGRIDLGLGRAPGTDGFTAQALRRDAHRTGDTFPTDVQELQQYFQLAVPGQRVRAVPGEGLNVPIWLLGSSLYSAQLAAHLGLPFAFASHFAPDDLMAALDIYRSTFHPSETLTKPYAMVAANVIAADTDREARRLFTSLQMAFLNIQRGQRGKVQPPVDTLEGVWSEWEQANVERMLTCTVVGSPETIHCGLQGLLARTQADELLLAGHIFDHAARLRSYEITAQVRGTLG